MKWEKIIHLLFTGSFILLLASMASCGHDSTEVLAVNKEIALNACKPENNSNWGNGYNFNFPDPTCGAGLNTSEQVSEILRIVLDQKGVSLIDSIYLLSNDEIKELYCECIRIE